MNIPNLKTALGSTQDLIKLAGELQRSIKGLGLDKLPIANLMSFIPKRTVSTLSLPLAAASFGAGMLTGAAAVAFLTPKRGVELRNLLNEQLQQAWTKATGSMKSAFENHEALDDLDNGKGEVRTYNEKRERDHDREISFPPGSNGSS